MRSVPSTASVLGRVVAAELQKLFVNRLAWAGWVFLIGASAFVMVLASTISVNVNEEAMGGPLTIPEGLAWTLRARNFYLAQVWLVVLAASSFAGEYTSRTLREDLARAVPRWAVLLAKWIALGAWSTVALVGQTIAGTLMGLGALEIGTGAGWGTWLAGLTGTIAGDVSFVAVALLVAVLTRRVATTIVAVVLFMGIERAFAATLFVISNLDPSTIELVVPGVPLTDIARVALPYLPANAWGVGTELAFGAEIAAVTWGALFGWTVLAAAVATLWFERLDAP